MTKQIFYIVTAFCIAVCSSFYVGKYSNRAICIICQAELIEAKIELKRALKNQVEYVQALNDAFGKTTEMAEAGK